MESTASATYRVQLLGGFEVRAGPRTVMERSWPRRKAQALIKLLGVHPGHRLHREQALDLLWPSLGPDDAANNLYKNLHHIRRQVRGAEEGEDAPLVVTSQNILALSDQATVDADEFIERAERARAGRTDASLYEAALEVYAGDLLPEDLYEEWTEPLRQELAETRNRLLLEVARLYDEQRRFELAIERLERLIHYDALHEQAHLMLMMIYVASGKRDRAIRQYQQCQRAFQRELSAAPSEEIETLYGQIVAGT